MTINERAQQLVNEFSYFDDWTDKYNYIIEMGKQLPQIDEQYKIPNYTIQGCQSQVWLHADFNNGKVYFTADSDAIITKGIIAILIKVFSDATPDEIINADLSFIDEIGLKEYLSPTRSNGLLSMLKQMQMYAYAFKNKK
ncbi:SufE family protein [Bacteroidales bacterium OttesenSCG-928-K03]|nr:SufE family protein [Odoribacter sp. OttesenSCG-928-L07]MDL2239792.1 SufE family protein [Bacteroidales bacterium OttesenSCG-928-L14]MDL2240423.1 SufE family protein [Bacteroidales bacterium OttesenSCG-928-K22]MDL2243004.1 SufE family protein [Bacteroidales bacterium OttesenSCG-928-K03]